MNKKSFKIKAWALVTKKGKLQSAWSEECSIYPTRKIGERQSIEAYDLLVPCTITYVISNKKIK